MPHLPEPIDEADAPGALGDPVVRLPKRMVVLAEPPPIPARTVYAVAALGLALGAVLGGVGIGIVWLAQRGRAHATGAYPTAAARGASAGSAVPLALRPTPPAGPAFTPLSALARGARTANEDDLVLTQRRLGRGVTLPVALRALGLEPPVAAQVVRALRPLVSMRSLRPDDLLLVGRERADPRPVRRVELRRGEAGVWVAHIDDEGHARAERVELVRTTAHLPVGLRVGEDLGASLRAASLRDEALSVLRATLEACGMPTTLRVGDALRVLLVEERNNGSFARYGAVEALDYDGFYGHRRVYWFAALGPRSRGVYYEGDGRSASELGPLRAPVRPARITSRFDPLRRHPTLDRVMPHLGVDFAAREGDEVYAAADGVVLSVLRSDAAGNLVRVRHAALGVETGYAHLSRFADGLRGGAPVRAGQLLGYAGSTGRSTGPHLHFSLKRGEQFIDPERMYRGRVPVPEAQRAELLALQRRLDAELDAIVLDGQRGQAPVSAPSAAPWPAAASEAPGEPDEPAGAALQ